MASLRSSGKIVGPSVSLRALAAKHRVSKPITVSKLLSALGVRGGSEIQFQFGTHNLPFPNFADGVPDWDTFRETFGASEVYFNLFSPIFGDPVLTLAFYELYKYYLKGTKNHGLATGFCTSLASLVADNFWTGVVSHSVDKASVHKRLTAVHGKLLSRQSILHFREQSLEGLARIERTCREIETTFLRGCTRKTAPLLFFIPAGGVCSNGYSDRLNRSHCVVPYRFAYPTGHPGPQLSMNGKATVNDLTGVELYVWDCNDPANRNCKLALSHNGDHLAFQYFRGSANAHLGSSENFSLGIMTNGAYMLADHDMPFTGIGSGPFTLDFLLSPADMQITKGTGQRTGLFDGQILAEIPGSMPCYMVPRAYLLPSGAALERRITGTGYDQYAFNSLTPAGNSVVLRGVATAPMQSDLIGLSPDQTELRFIPGNAKLFDLTVARRVGDEIRGMTIQGIGNDQAAEFRFHTSAEFDFCNLANAGRADKLNVQMLRINRQGRYSRNLQVTGSNTTTSNELHVDALDWNSVGSGPQ